MIPQWLRTLYHWLRKLDWQFEHGVTWNDIIICIMALVAAILTGHMLCRLREWVRKRRGKS